MKCFVTGLLFWDTGKGHEAVTCQKRFRKRAIKLGLTHTQLVWHEALAERSSRSVTLVVLDQ